MSTPDRGDGHNPAFWNLSLGPHGDRDGLGEDNINLGPDPLTPFPKESYPPTFVGDLHQHSDVDSSTIGQHHTLGSKRNQAAPGNHTHDGGSSSLIGGWTQYINNANSGSFWLGASFAVAIGNGTIVGKYCLINKLCHVKLWLQFGSTTNPGTAGDYWIFILPFATTATDGQLSGGVTCYSGTANVGGIIQPSNANWWSLVNHANGSFWGAGNPVVWGTGSNLACSFFYELP